MLCFLQFFMCFREFFKCRSKVSDIRRNWSFDMDMMGITKVQLCECATFFSLNLCRIALRKLSLGSVMFRYLSTIAHTVEVLQADWIVASISFRTKFSLFFYHFSKKKKNTFFVLTNPSSAIKPLVSHGWFLLTRARGINYYVLDAKDMASS